MLKAVAPVLLVLCALATPASAADVVIAKCTTVDVLTNYPVLTVCRPLEQ